MGGCGCEGCMDMCGGCLYGGCVRVCEGECVYESQVVFSFHGEFQGLNSGYQDYQQVLLSNEPSCQPIAFLLS